MIATKTYLKIFIPALFIVLLALIIRVIQYEPQFPKFTPPEQRELTIPIYADDPIIGNKKAVHTIIVFEDISCANCIEQFNVFQELITAYPNEVKIIWKGLPINTFPNNTKEAHQYAYCANKQDEFYPFIQYAFTNGTNLSTIVLDTIVEEIADIDEKKLKKCLETEQSVIDAYIAKNEEIAHILGIQTLPATFIKNKQVVASTLDEWKLVLNLR
ncbi:MAG: DsbA family protein [Candidatus Magasanikbacteria bacterium]|jgi:protein-disulfide isomerase|nr:DsbA family protein [Candidatus Magasanikbacteria bacterium]